MAGERKRKVQKDVYFSAVEWDRIVRRMRSVGKTNFSQYARDVLTSGRIFISREASGSQTLAGQIGRIGNNLNQIARMVNTNQKVETSQSMEALEILDEIRVLVTQYTKAASHGGYQNSSSPPDTESSDPVHL